MNSGRKDTRTKRLRRIVRRRVRWLSYMAVQCPRRLEDKITGNDFYQTDRDSDAMDAGGYDYMASWPSSKLRCRQYFSKVDCSNLNLLDVGCGKGAMVHWFAKSGFCKRVDGLEYSQRIADIAKTNLARLNVPSTILVDDAATFSGYDDYDIFYLFNPFSDVVIRPFGQLLLESHSRRPRKVAILYYNPRFKSIFLDLGFQDVTHEYLNGGYSWAHLDFSILELSETFEA